MPDKQLPYTKEEQDGRRKLTELEKEEIRMKYKPRVYSYQMLADEYRVSKRLIFWVVNPHRLEEFQRSRKGVWNRYYNKEDRRLTMQKYRAKKRALGLLASQNKNLYGETNTLISADVS